MPVCPHTDTLFMQADTSVLVKWLWPWCKAIVAGDVWELGIAALTWCDPEGCRTGERVPGDGWTLALEVPAGGFCWGCPGTTSQQRSWEWSLEGICLRM